MAVILQPGSICCSLQRHFPLSAAVVGSECPAELWTGEAKHSLMLCEEGKKVQIIFHVGCLFLLSKKHLKSSNLGLRGIWAPNSHKEMGWYKAFDFRQFWGNWAEVTAQTFIFQGCGTQKDSSKCICHAFTYLWYLIVYLSLLSNKREN